MRVMALALSVACLQAVAVAHAQGGKPPPLIAPTDPLTPAKEREAFRLPPGFEIQLVAAEPDINKPINIAFDAKGRLWVTGSVEYPFAAKGRGRDKVWILDKFADDGRAQRIATFADDLNIPIGVLPTSKGAIVYTIANIVHLIDTDGDGKADKRETLFTDYGFGDTHGMTGEFMRGLDGWIYACHGFANNSRVKDKTGNVRIEMTSGNTYRFKPDGARIEYFTHGQVNPFGLAFDAAGNLYSCDCHSRPIYQLLKGAWYPSFEKPHDGLGFGPEMMRHSHESTAIAGIAITDDENWPAEFRHNVFIGNVVTNRINRDKIEWHGSSPQAIEMPDFVECDDPWFRPVDIKLGPDGALYIADFYNRIIGHYEVDLKHPGRDREKGRIWRIVYRGEQKQMPLPKMPDLTKLSTAELATRLRHVNLTVRMQAVDLLVERGGPEVIKHVRAIVDDTTDYPHGFGLWVLERLGALDDARLTRATKASWSLARIHATRILAEREQWRAGNRALVLAALRPDEDAMVQRAAVQALASHPQPENVAVLLDYLPTVSPKDTHLRHAVRIALRDQLTVPDVWKKLPKLNEQKSRAIADVCTGLRSRESAEFLLEHVQRSAEPTDNLVRYAHHIVRYGPAGSVSKVLVLDNALFNKDVGVRGEVFKAALKGVQERGDRLGAEDAMRFEKLTLQVLDSRSEGHKQVGIDLATALKLESAIAAIQGVARAATMREEVRRSAVAALGNIAPAKQSGFLAQIMVNANDPIGLREQAAQALGVSNTPESQEHLLKALAQAPARLERTIAFALVGSRSGAEKLLDAVAGGKASARLLQDQTLATRLRQAKIADVDGRLKKLTADLPPADRRIQELLDKRRGGFFKAKTDVALGAKIYEKNCAICHQINNQGSKIGPQLDGIGNRGLERLLEDVLDPNRNVDQAFRATALALKDGRFLSVLVLRQEGKVLVYADPQGKEQRIDVDAVESRSISPLSPMPSTFVEQFAEADFYHLMAFLLAQRPKSK